MAQRAMMLLLFCTASIWFSLLVIEQLTWLAKLVAVIEPPVIPGLGVTIIVHGSEAPSTVRVMPLPSV